MDRTYLEDRETFLSDAMRKIDEGLYDDAIALADARLNGFPGDIDACLVIAACQAWTGNPAEARETVEQWHDIVRDRSRVYEVLGDAYNRDGMTKEAIEAYTRFAALNPDTPASGRVSEKIASLQETAVEEGDEDEPSDMSPDFYTVTLARLYVKQGHFKMARDVIGKILERDPENVEAGKYAAHVEHLMEEGWGPVVDELDRWLNELRKKKGR